jgi:hypothetical protein
MKLLSGIVLTLLLASVLLSACKIQSVESAPETQTLGSNEQVSTCRDQISQYDSLSDIASKFSDKSVGETSRSDKLERDFESGQIGVSQYLLYKAWRVFDPGKVPEEYALPSEETQLYGRSATMIIDEIRENWKNLNPETQNELEFVFKRPTDVGGGRDDNRTHLLPKLYNTTNFVIHWTNGTDGGASADAVPLGDANTNGVPDYVEDFAEIFENVRSFEVGNRGFPAPPNDAAEPNDPNRRNPDQRYDIFVYNMSSYGWTVPEHLVAEQLVTPSYSHIEVDNDYLDWYFSTRGLQAMQVTAAHEFFHAVQYYYSLATVLDAKWWKEATSTYMEDEVYPDVNDNYQYLPFWFETCALLGLTHQYPFKNHVYGDFIFAKRLSEDFGDGVIKEIWGETNVYLAYDAIDNVLKRRGSNFTSEFNRFIVANFFLEDMYVDGADYRQVLSEAHTQGECSFNGVNLEYEYDASFEFDYTLIDKTNVNGIAWEDMLAANYITIRLDPAAEKYRILFDGLDPNTDYLVQLATKKGGVIQPTRAFSLSANQGYLDLSYDAFDNITLVITNAASIESFSWRIIITKFSEMKSLRYDDGTSEAHLSWDGTGNTLAAAVRFTPTMSGRLMECTFFIYEDPAPVKIRVMDKNRINVIPPLTKTPTSLGWLHVDLSAFQLPVTAQVDFYVAIEWTVANEPGLGTDLTGNPDGRSWFGQGGTLSQAPLDYGDFMIGAIVAAVSPDLTILDISWNPSEPVEGGICNFTAYIVNLGSVDAGSFKVAYYLDGSKVGEWSITDLRAGYYVIKSFTWTATAGNHTVKVFADSGYSVQERFETNNGREETFQVGPRPKPDLIISGIAWKPEAPASGATVTVAVTIKNNGTGSAGSFKTAYYVNQTKLGEWSTTSLSPGQGVNTTFTWTYVEGTHIIKAVADSNGEIQEEDETNNMREEVMARALVNHDVAITDISLYRSVVSNRTVTSMNVTVQNQGDVQETFTIILSYNSTAFGSQMITVSNGSSITLSFSWNTTGVSLGNYTIAAAVDQLPGETDTTDNSQSTQVQVSILGDINGDGRVDMKDVSKLAQAFVVSPTSPKWESNGDLDENKIIDMKDISSVAKHFSEHT